MSLSTTEYEDTDVARIDVIYLDGVIDQFNTKVWNGEDGEYIQERIDNLMRSEFNEGLLDSLVAYDFNGDKIAVRTAEEFFTNQEGF